MSAASTLPAVLEARGLGRVFGEGELAVRVLHPTNVAFRAGELAIVSGPSGSGKTTLLSMLGLVLSPTDGEVHLAGRRVSGLPADTLAGIRLRELGFVFQQFNLLAGLDALENVALPLVLAKVSVAERRRRALEALDRVGLADRAGHKPRQLSGGQQQRVAVARAIVTHPRVLLCDEPTASLDATAGRLVMDLLRDLADEGDRAVVVVTHDDRVHRVADRIVHVADGRVVDDHNLDRS